MNRWSACVYLAVAASFLLPSAPAVGQGAGSARAPRDWIVDAAAHEVDILKDADVYLRYRMHVVNDKGDQTRDVIESKDGTVARLILRDGKPLTTEQDTAEQERLNAMIASPESYAKHVKNDASGKKLATDLIKLMPDAMIYTYAPAQSNANEVVLDYHPSSSWKPPTTTAEALTGLEGRMWIDTKTHTMVRMEGHIFKPVNFGWGLLAHIYPGGNLALTQTNVGGRRWIYTHFTQEVTVRALMVKTLNVHSQVDASAFQILPGALSYQEAIHLLLATPLPTH